MSGDDFDEVSPNNQDGKSQESKTIIRRALGLVRSGVVFLTRNGQLTHSTPLPPPADVAELEYISALHQCASMQALNQDGSITAGEIALFLKSRHGITVSPELVRTVVLQDGLTADKDENSPGEDGDEDGGGGVMDLVELASALIIPNLLRLRRKKIDENRIRGSAGKARALLASMKGQRNPTIVMDQTLADNVDILRDVLAHILEDCTGDSRPKRLNADLVRDILKCFGEGALAKDDELVREMVEVAATGTVSGQMKEESASETQLNINTFVEALTCDVARQSDPGRDERCSTNFEDVWWSISESDVHGVEDEESGNIKTATLIQRTLLDHFMSPKCCRRKQGMNSNEHVDKSNKIIIKRHFTGEAIDYTVDNFRSRFLVICLWVSFVTYYVAYLGFNFGDGGYTSKHCSNNDTSLQATVVCPLVSGIVGQLLLFAELILFGFSFICLGSVGNSIDGTETMRRMAVGTILFALLLLVPYFAEFEVSYWISTKKGEGIAWHAVSLGCGAIILFLQLLHLIVLWIRTKFPYQRNLLSRYFQFGNVGFEAKIKRSALFKIDRMLSNAHGIHRTVKRRKSVESMEDDENDPSQFLSNFGRAMQEYVKVDGKRTYIGGIGWTWKRIIDGTLFTEEGIWISGRVFAGTVFQVVVAIASPIVVYFAFPLIEDRVNPDDNEGIEMRSKIVVGIASTCAFLTSVLLTVLFIPTMISTTLKFRRGVLPSLRSEDFLHRYRFALDQVALVYGGMVWGVLFSSAAIALVTGGFVYLLMWERTQNFVLSFVGQLIGLSVVLILKIIIMQIFRFTFYGAFYRRRPLAANVLTTVIEVYSIAISIWFMAVRCIKIVIIAALYVGRIDTPLFAPGVGIFGPLEIDNWPTVSRKEILIHEAHRHPYLETMGYLYMMQLRYRDGGFARRACSAWRLVFVLALMPWLHKYRDMTRPAHFGDEDDDDTCEDGNALMLALAAPSAPGQTQLQASKSIRFTRQSMAMKQSMVSPRWLVENLALDENEGCGKASKSGGSTGRDRIAEIDQEIENLQKEKEMLSLEAKAQKEREERLSALYE